MALWMLPADYETLQEERDRKRKAKLSTRADVFAAVDKRDQMICRACGCWLIRSLARDPKRLEHHHIVPKSLGGKDEVANLVSVCRADHILITRHRLTVTGDPNAALTFSAEHPRPHTWVSWPPRQQQLSAGESE